MKKCFKCKEIKELDQFHEHKGMTDGRLNKCAECVRAYAVNRYKTLDRNDINNYRRADYAADPSKYKERRLKSVYGITYTDYTKLLEAQGGVCAVCKLPGKLVVDHNHKTNRVRGLLHHQCNSALGLLLDSVDVLTNAASYLATDGDI